MVRRAPIQKMNVACRQIDAREEVLLHERAVASFVARRKADELVDVEGVRLREICLARLVQRDERVIHSQRRAPSRQADDRR